MKFLIGIYQIFLHLYPKQFRIQYGDEMICMVDDTLIDAAAAGPRHLLITWIQELFNIFPNAAREHIWRATQMDIQLQEIKSRPAWYFYILWIIINTAALPVAFQLSMGIMNILQDLIGGRINFYGQERITADYLWIYAFSLLWGLLAGFGQYALLRRYITKFRRWIVITGVIWPAIIWILLIIVRYLNETRGMSLGVQTGISSTLLVTGGFLSILQWLMLRKRLKHAWIWILASCLGWLLAPLYIRTEFLLEIGVVLLAIFPAITTGIALWLLFYLTPMENRVDEPVEITS